MTAQDEYFMKQAIRLAEKGMARGAGGPFGAVIVKDNQIIAKGYNSVLSHKDPTAHAEIMAIRKASKKLNSFQLTDCTIYTSCEPCPMCLGAIYWARLSSVFYACNRDDAAEIDFDDQHIYQEIALPVDQRQIIFTELLRLEALPLFKQWRAKSDRTDY